MPATDPFEDFRRDGGFPALHGHRQGGPRPSQRAEANEIGPDVDERVIEYAVQRHIPIFSGALTPTEVVRAFQAGAAMVKIFPSRSVGPGYIKELRGPLAHIPLMAVGGVSADNAAEFIQAGVQAVGVGGSLVEMSAILKKDFAKIRQKAKELVSVVQDALSNANDPLVAN